MLKQPNHKIILITILLWLCVSVLAQENRLTAGQEDEAEVFCREGINEPSKDCTYYYGSIVGELCNTHFKIGSNFNYRYSTMSCGHGVEACEYQTLNDGYILLVVAKILMWHILSPILFFFLITQRYQ